MNVSGGQAFAILLAAGLPLAALHWWSTSEPPPVYLPLVFALAGALAIMLAALSRAGWRRSPSDAGSHAEPNPLPWVALAGVLWLTAALGSQFDPSPSRLAAFLLMWAAVAASAVAVAEAYAVQQVRVRVGHSRLPPSSVVAGGVVLFLVQPLLTPMIALAIALIRRAETRQTAA